MTRLQPGAQGLADVLGPEAFPGLLESGQDLAVAGRQGHSRRGAVLGGQFQHGLARDLKSFQGPFGGGEVFAEPVDLLTQLLGRLPDELLPGLDLVQEFPHRGSRRVGVLGARRAGHARSGWRCG